MLLVTLELLHDAFCFLFYIQSLCSFNSSSACGSIMQSNDYLLQITAKNKVIELST